jgi:predicted ATPase/class 3 adenylate cyclase/DNA-binding CsgD family transcriptional regulator
MAVLPTGTVTFLFTDLEGSSRLWEEHPARMPSALARHDAVLHAAVQAHDGQVVKSTGDGLYAVFTAASHAVATALAAQRALQAEEWGELGALRTRMSLHTGVAELRDDDYFGPAVNRAARLLELSQGGQAVLSAVVAGLVRDGLPSGAAVRDIGEHRLRDLSEPERVFQLIHPDLPDDAPSPRGAPARSHNLPMQLTAFVGRGQELTTVKDLLATARLLTLTGTGGCGKTRLALRTAEHLLDDFADGVWLIELASLAELELVPHAVAAALGVREEPGQAVEQTLVAVLGTKRTLLILDNCEHVLVACAALADLLLKSCPGLRILATSREVLGMAGEVSWRVPSLSLPPVPIRVVDGSAGPRSTVEDLVRYEATQLFVDRAVAALPSFELTAQNASAVERICRRLDGIPLAIELAAARVKALAPEQIADRLDQRFRLLTGGSRTSLPRLQTLQALVDWSYGLLDRLEQLLFHRLSVFAGGFTLESAEEVCAGGEIESADVMDLLLRLVDKSLVLAEGGDVGAQRFRLLETLRQYARERLVATNEAAASYGRHATYFLSLAEELEPALHGPRPRPAFDRVETEQDNLRAALRWFAEAGTTDEAMRLAAVLAWFWYVRGYYSEGLGWLAEALALPAEGAPSVTRSRVCWLASLMAYRQGDLAAAWTLNEEALTIGHAAGDAVRISQSRLLTGVLHRAQGGHRAARFAFEDGLATAIKSCDQFTIALSRYWLAMAALDQGDYPSARALLEESLAVRRRIDDSWACLTSLERLATVALQQRDYQSARAYADESLAIAREIGYPLGIVRSLRTLGALALIRGDPQTAREHYAEALAVCLTIGDRTTIAELLEAFAAAAAERGAAVQALRLAGAASSLRDTLGISHAPAERDRMTRALEPARRALGADASAAWTIGTTLSVDQAVELALADETLARPESPAQSDSLTSREREVVVLIARGLSNQEIADERVVSVRTVESHVANIRAKLELDSRARIAVWAIERGLLG